MSYLKALERSSTPAFCPSGGLMAAGTVAGAIDMSFSTNSVLEVFALDFSTSGDALSVVGSVQAPERFNRLAWGAKVPDSPQSLGIIAGGLADGSLILWDARVVMDKDAKSKGATPLLAKMQKHTGGVKGLEFNTFSPNLLASGAADGDLCIWDLAKPSTPSLYPALKSGAGPAGNGELAFISWNRKVQHILASCSSNGSTVVWDLKRQKPVISFRDPNSQRRASVLQWNPEVATQLVVASDDDRSPTLQMWDLRNSVSPLKEFVGHSKGVLGMAWSPHDTSLLLSSGKDGRTICWDVNTTDVLCELPQNKNWNFDVQWSPTIPGVFSTASFDGHVGVHNIHCCTLGAMVETVNSDFTVSHEAAGDSVPLKKAPEWMKRPVGAAFGFGGKLVSFANQRSQVTDGTGQVHFRDHAAFTMSTVVTEFDLISRSEKFEQAIAGGEKETLQSFCQSKSQTLGGEEAETWAFLGLLFEGDARRELQRRLGFADVIVEPALEKEVDADALAAGMDGLMTAMSSDARPNTPGAGGLTPTTSGPQHSMGGNPEDFFDQEDDPDFFDKLPDQEDMSLSQEDVLLSNGSLKKRPSAAASEPDKGGEHDKLVDGSTEKEEDIQRALIAGNFEAAVDCCFKAGRLADALLIANIFNGELFKKTMQRYMRKCPKPYMQIVRANVDQDFEALVRTRPVGQWRDTLALLATYTGQDGWATLCDMLASRLSQAGMHHAASLCYICAGTVDPVVALWTREVACASPAASPKGTAPLADASALNALQSVIEKAVIFGLATGNKKASSSLADLVTNYASILAAQGRLSTALEYLEYVPGEASTTVAVLRDRIYRSGSQLPPSITHAPPFPFIQEDVRPVAPQPTPPKPAVASTTAPAPASSYGAQPSAYPVQQAAAAPAANPYSSYNNYSQQPQQPAQQQPAAPAPAPQHNPYAQQPNPYSHAPSQAQTQQQAQQHSAYTPQAAAPQQSMYGQQPQQQPASHTTYTPQPPSNMYTQPAAPASNAYTQPHSTYTQQAAAQPAPPVYGGYSQPAASATTTTAAPAPSFQPTTTAYGQTAASQYSAPSYSAAPASHSGMPAQNGPSGHSAQPVAQPHYFAPTTTVTSAAAAPYSVPAPTGAQGHYPGAVPGMMVPQAPAATAPVKPSPPPPPPGPPANISVATADTSAVRGDLRPIVDSLARLYDSCLPMANNPAKKREMEDNTKKLGQLFWRLNAGDVTESVLPKMMQLCQAIDVGDWHTANHIQVQMTTTDWDACGFWLSVVKRLIKTRQTMA